MATANGGVQQAFEPVMQALNSMRDGHREQKKAALEFLETFQKSEEAWEIVIGILQSDLSPEVQIFAATTLKGKITYDINQLPRDALPALRTQILALLKAFAPGPRPIRTQLCVGLAVLAIQMREWKDVLSSIVSALGDDAASHACILEFLKVLPEEVTEGRKITLTEDELNDRTQELLGDNAEKVLKLLIGYSQSSASAATNPQLLECVTSWLREIPVDKVVSSPLLDSIFAGLDKEVSFEAAVDCLCSIFKETSEVNEYFQTIKVLYPRLCHLRPRIAQAAASEDSDLYKGVTRLFTEAGESWIIMIAKEPVAFRPLVEAIMECAARDSDREAISLTFEFWYQLKLYLVMETYIQTRLQFVDVYAKLVDIFMKHLEYPTPDDPSEIDLFDGDRELEDKFREFRHQIGDVLKSCCEVMGVTECLTKVLDRIKLWMRTYASQATITSVPHWQKLEAPLFSMRAMGRMVDNEEDIILPQIMPLIVQIPNHEKLRFAAIMVIGRYTEWTANHPEYLEAQFTYIISSFNTHSKEIIRAAAMSLKFFCTDCKHLLGGQVLQLQNFYEQTLDSLPTSSQEEMTEGVAAVVAVQPSTEIYKLLKLYCDPLMTRLMDKVNKANDADTKLAVADHIQLITIFVQWIVPHMQPEEENPAVKYCGEIFPILAAIVDKFIDNSPICERICRCWRNMVISYRTAMTPLLGALANKLASGFEQSRQGCFLWVTSAILREFSEDREHVDVSTTNSIYAFFEAQSRSMLHMMNDLLPVELPDVIEDFFRLLTDAILYYPLRLIPSELFQPIFDAAVAALALEQRETLIATLHYIRDVIGYGGDNPPSSGSGPNPPEIKQIVLQLLLQSGEILVERIMAGMMITFPRDCFADGSGVLLGMLEIVPQQTAVWITKTIAKLPKGTMTEAEAKQLMRGVVSRLSEGPNGLRQIRSLLQDFTNIYRRRYIAPRDGLGRLEATRFRFNG